MPLPCPFALQKPGEVVLTLKQPSCKCLAANIRWACPPTPLLSLPTPYDGTVGHSDAGIVACWSLVSGCFGNRWLINCLLFPKAVIDWSSQCPSGLLRELEAEPRLTVISFYRYNDLIHWMRWKMLTSARPARGVITGCLAQSFLPIYSQTTWLKTNSSHKQCFHFSSPRILHEFAAPTLHYSCR